MVDQLNNASHQSKRLDAAPTMRRLDTYLAQGQTRTAQVVQVTPQLQPGPAANAQPLPANTPQLPPASANPQATPQQTGPASTPAPPPTNTAMTATGTAAQPPTSTELFKIQVRLEGRLFELITHKPLPPGSTVEISRDSGNRISLQLAPPVQQSSTGQQLTPQPQPSATGQQLTPQPQPSATGQTGAAASAHAVRDTNLPAQERPPQPAARQPGTPSAAPSTTTSAATATGNPATLQATSRTTTSANPTTAATPSGNQSGLSKTNGTPTHTATSRPVAANSASQPAVERIRLQPLKAELPIRPGERLNAEVISSRPNPAAVSSPAPATNTGADSHTIRINLQGQKIELVSPRPLPQGSQLQLVHDSKGQLWAELPSAKTQAIEQVLREHLPQQQSPAPLLNLLAGAQASGQLQQAKPLLLNLINLLAGRSLTSPHKADADSVKQQVQDSGSLLENKLARGETQNLGQDHKALLLRLAQQLGQPSSQTELPKTLSEQITQLTQQALSRVLVNQITSSLGGQAQETGTEPNRTLALDIPVAWQGNTENLQLKVQREPLGTDAESEEMQYRWRIRLNFEIEGSRQLEAELTLENERISVIWSGDRRIRDQVEGQLDKLQQRLESIGLQVQTLGVRENLPDSDATLKPPRNRLIDITT